MPKLESLFSPKSVAVIGASTKTNSVGYACFANILLSGYTGVVYPVNPKARSVLAVKAYPSVLDIEDEVDLAIVVVPGRFVGPVLKDCGKKGVKAAVVISAGFGELGEDGARKQEEVVRTVRDAGIPMVGPNCLGVINTAKDTRLNASFARGMPEGGNIALISQSGAVGVAALEYAASEGIGLSRFVSVGNKADLNESDLLEYMRDDPDTDVILLYVEDLAEPGRFIELAREITGELKQPKPIIAIKSGRTEAGARAASSHTGALAGSDVAYESLFRQSGVLRVDSLEEMFEVAVAFSQQQLPRGKRVAIVTNAGGPGIMTTDACVRHGLEVPSFSKETVEKLKEGLPAAAAVGNPVDVIGDADPARYRHALDTVLRDENVDSLIVISTPQLMTKLKDVADTIADVVREHYKPAFACLMSLREEKDALARLKEAGIPNYPFPQDAARALAAMSEYSEWLHRPRTQVRKFQDVDRNGAERVIRKAREEGRNFLPEPEAYKILRAYGFPLLPTQVATSASEAVAAATEIGYPVAIKIVSPQIIHKIDVGGVKLHLQSGDEVHRAYEEMMQQIRITEPDADLQGVVVQKMADKGREVILGVKRDPHFGPLLLFGLGGTFVEVFKDVSFRLAPLTELGAGRMIKEIQGAKILTGYRGQPPADLASLIECMQRLSQMSMELEDIRELDMNPFLVYDEGKGALVLDARIFLT